jgi:hypothetical protein
VLLLTIALGLGLSALIPTPATESEGVLVSGTLALLLTLVGAGVMVQASRRRGPQVARLPLQPVVLVVGIALLANAVYGGLRLETRSQHRTTSAQLSAELVVDGDLVEVVLQVDAEKLSADEWVTTSIDGVRHDVDLAAACEGYDGCLRSPCHYEDVCTFLGGSQLSPDAMGTVDETVEFPVDATAYAHLSVRARICDFNGCEIPPDDGVRHETSMDFRLPPQLADAEPATATGDGDSSA